MEQATMDQASAKQLIDKLATRYWERLVKAGVNHYHLPTPDAEEAAQEALLLYSKKVQEAGYKPPEKEEGHKARLFKIFDGCARNRRKCTRRRFAWMQPSADLVVPESSATANGNATEAVAPDNLEDEYARKEALERIMQSYEKIAPSLKPEERNAFIRFVQGQAEREIGREIGVEHSTIRNWIKKIFDRVREDLPDQYRNLFVAFLLVAGSFCLGRGIGDIVNPGYPVIPDSQTVDYAGLPQQNRDAGRL